MVIFKFCISVGYSVACSFTPVRIVMKNSFIVDVDESILVKLCAAFEELRILSDNGQLPYPYSVRELVNIAKHLQVGSLVSVHCVIRY